MWRKCRPQVNHAVDANFRPEAELRAVKDRCSGGDENAILKLASDDVSVRSDQAVLPDVQRVNVRTPKHCVLHHDQGAFQIKAASEGYPPDLETLVNGIDVGGKKMKFLRRIPTDPMTGGTDWGLRAMQHDPTQIPGMARMCSMFIRNQTARGSVGRSTRIGDKQATRGVIGLGLLGEHIRTPAVCFYA
jgi:hypothetical protein